MNIYLKWYTAIFIMLMSLYGIYSCFVAAKKKKEQELHLPDLSSFQQKMKIKRRKKTKRIVAC